MALMPTQRQFQKVVTYSCNMLGILPCDMGRGSRSHELGRLLGCKGSCMQATASDPLPVLDLPSALCGNWCAASCCTCHKGIAVMCFATVCMQHLQDGMHSLIVPVYVFVVAGQLRSDMWSTGSAIDSKICRNPTRGL